MKIFFLFTIMMATFMSTTNDAIAQRPSFSAQSYLVADQDGNIIQMHNSNNVRPIASITKLMVGLLAAEQDLSEYLSIPRQRTVQSSIPRNVTKLTRRDLLILSMVRSDNFAAQILCDNIPSCVEKMNERAVILGMKNTRFSEPTGLSRLNVSTAEDLLKLMMVASDNYVLGKLSSMPSAVILTDRTRISIRNTNPLTSRLDITLSKTGFTRPAGGSLVMKMDSSIGKRIIILLGSRNARTRIPDTERLISRNNIF